MTAQPIKLAVRNVRKSFRIRGRREADDRILNVLGDVSFDVRQGEIVSIIGESGCGKTTLLKIVQGLIRADAGAILVDGAPVTGPGRDRGFVFQHASLLPWRTAAQNVEFGLELQAMAASERTATARKLLTLVNLAHARISIRISCRAACSSGSAWRGRWPSIRRSC